MKVVQSLLAGDIELHRITLENLAAVRAMFENEPDAQDMMEEIESDYLPKYDDENRLTKYGFYVLKAGKIAGLSLLTVDSWEDARGSTGADFLGSMRGQGLAPGSKPHLFYLGFAVLGLNRIETGHFVSNRSSQRSIEKTPGFVFEGILREHGRNDDGEFEDVKYYGIIRRDWLELYKDLDIAVVYQ
jgi:RimJ/RimL family protein N-acetyltransferase